MFFCWEVHPNKTDGRWWYCKILQLSLEREKTSSKQTHDLRSTNPTLTKLGFINLWSLWGFILHQARSTAANGLCVDLLGGCYPSFRTPQSRGLVRQATFSVITKIHRLKKCGDLLDLVGDMCLVIQAVTLVGWWFVTLKKGVKWPPTRGWKGHGLNHLVCVFFSQELHVFFLDFCWKVLPRELESVLFLFQEIDGFFHALILTCFFWAQQFIGLIYLSFVHGYHLLQKVRGKKDTLLQTDISKSQFYGFPGG